PLVRGRVLPSHPHAAVLQPGTQPVRAAPGLPGRRRPQNDRGGRGGGGRLLVPWLHHRLVSLRHRAPGTRPQRAHAPQHRDHRARLRRHRARRGRDGPVGCRRAPPARLLRVHAGLPPRARAPRLGRPADRAAPDGSAGQMGCHGRRHRTRGARGVRRHRATRCHRRAGGRTFRRRGGSHERVLALRGRRRALGAGARGVQRRSDPFTVRIQPTLYEMSQRRPESRALEDGTRRRTWGELERRTRAIAHGLRQRAPDESSHVALVATNRVEFVEVALACLRAGLVYTPLKSSWTPSEIGTVLSDASTRLVVTDMPAGRWSGLDFDLPVIDLDRHFDAWVDQQADEPLPYELAGKKITYTSGTTGRPKGVVSSYLGRRPFAESYAASAGMAELTGL